MAKGSVNVGGHFGKRYITIDMVGVPGGLATLDEQGKLSYPQRQERDCYIREETDKKIDENIASHNFNETAHPAIQNALALLTAKVNLLELKYSKEISENTFYLSFETLDDVIVTGVWNEELCRIEF